MTTEERTRYVCRRLTERVGEVAPPGLGKWDRAWEVVADPSTAFLDALREWEGEDTPKSRARLQAAADAVVKAWRLASQEWEARGRPGADAPEGVPA
jgi:hypothetical protein